MVSARQVVATVTTAGGRVALAAAAILLAACGGQHAAAPATPSPAASSPAPQGGTSASATGSVHLPARLLGLKENTSATAMQAASILRRGLASRLTGDVVGEKAAVYGGEQNASPFFLVVAGAWAKQVARPDNVAHLLREFLVAKGFTDARLLPAGPRGEARACGRKHVQAGTDTVCEWADHASFGAVLYPPGFTSSLSDAASQTSQVHAAVVG